MKINKLCDYKGLKIGKPTPKKPSEEELNATLQGLLEQHATTEIKNSEAENGDTVNLDFEGFQDGVAFEGGKGVNYDLVLGSHTFIPGFEDQLVGHKAGDEVDVNVTFPENYQAENLKGKPAVFKCKINKVLIKKPAVLDDDFAKKFEMSSVDELKKALEDQLYVKNANKELNEYVGKVWQHIYENSDVEFDDEELESKINEVVNYYGDMMKQYGATLDQYLEMAKMTLDDFKKQVRPDAVNMMIMDIVTAHVIEKENLIVTEEDLDAEVAQIKAYYNLPEEECNNIRKNEVENLKKDILKSKISKLLLDSNE